VILQSLVLKQNSKINSKLNFDHIDLSREILEINLMDPKEYVIDEF
jgi:hypothetical protein